MPYFPKSLFTSLEAYIKSPEFGEFLKNREKQKEEEEYQKFVESMAEYCHCTGQHNPCPCDGVLSGGLCDNRHDEPDFTKDDLEYEDEE